ncbi:hypothetical protein LCGC14_2619320 [marine sediment metagenome]|uniref:Uncharacterized protein n=1 Tax=marine sediment metagenome TaxID=412755 RepID=A0A0F9CEI8_9ZZZZ
MGYGALDMGYGIKASDIAAIMAVTDALPDSGALTTITTEVEKTKTFYRDFWSDVQALVTITATAQDLSLPSVVVAGLPAGATVARAIAIFKYRAAQDTSGSANNLDDGGGTTTPAIQVRADTPGTYIDAINVVDGMVQVVASTRDSGDVWMGDNDVKSEVDENDTYEFQFDDAEAEGGNLLLRDVQCGLRVYFTL